MKWILGYVAGALLLLAPAGMRMLLRAPAAPEPLDEAAVRQGKMLFTHEWTVNDPLAAGGDGLGPVFNATSCLECHAQGGLGGSGGLQHNVTTFFAPPSSRNQKAVQGVIHARAVDAKYQETLAHASPELPALVRPTLEQVQNVPGSKGRIAFPAQVSQRNTPALFGAKLIDELPDQVILANERSQKLRWREPQDRGESAPVGHAQRLRDGRLGKFGWKAQSPSLLDFVQAACANELGLGNPGQAQPAPLGVASYKPRGLDLTTEQCEQMAAFIAALPRPREEAPQDATDKERVTRGRHLFHGIGCAECHVPTLGSLDGVYSDFLLHRMGGDLVGGGSYHSQLPGTPDSPGDEPLPDEWRTPPLWGVADSAPYLHDGRAATLHDAIRLHAGQAAASANRFGRMSPMQQHDLIRFLKSLRAPS